MNTNLEKLYTNLRIAHKEAELATLNKQSSIEAVMNHLLTEFQELLTAHAGEKFAITIDGTFNKTEAYRMHDHQTRMTSFSYVFVGAMRNDPVLIGADVSSLTGRHSPLPSHRLFKEISPGVITESKTLLYMMQCSPSDDAQWYPEDFLIALAPEDIKPLLKPRKDPESSEYEKVTLWIGNARFEEYLGTRDETSRKIILDLFQ